MAKTDMDRELKKGSTELLILSLLEARARHGYDIGRQIELRSGGVVQLHVASLYPLLYRLERAGLVAGRVAGGRKVGWRGGARGAAATTASPPRAAACSRTRRTPGAPSWPRSTA